MRAHLQAFAPVFPHCEGTLNAHRVACEPGGCLTTDAAVGILLAAVPAAITLVVLVLSLRAPGTPVGRSFAWLVSTLFVWQMVDAAMRVVGSESSAQFVRHAARIGWLLAIPAALHFALRYTRRTELADQPLTYALLYTPALVVQSLYNVGWLHDVLVHVPVWGWVVERTEGSAAPWITAWFVILALATMGLLAHHAYRLRDEPEPFRRASWLTIAIALPLGVGLVTEVAVPQLVGARHVPLTSTALVLFSIWALVGWWRTSLFDFDTVASARDVIDALSDAVLIFDVGEQLQFANHVAAHQFHVDALRDLFRSEREHTAFVAGPWTKAISGRPQHGLEMTLRLRSDATVPALVSLSPVEQGNHRGVVMVAHDIRTFLETQKELAEARAEAEQARQDGPWLHQVGDHLLDLARQADAPELSRLLGTLIGLTRADADRQELNLGSVDVRAELEAYQDKLTEAIAPKRLDLHLPSGSVPAYIDRNHFRQVLLGVLRYTNQTSPIPSLYVGLSTEGPHTLIELRVPTGVRAEHADALVRGEVPPVGDPSERLGFLLSRRLLQRMGCALRVKRLPNPSREISLEFELRMRTHAEAPVPSSYHDLETVHY